MLHIHRSERADGLVAALRELLAEPLGDPFAAEVVCVPTRGMERWLTQRMSACFGATPGRADGVCANVEFPSPRRLVGDAVAAASGIDPDDDIWLPERLVWPLLEVVDGRPPFPRIAPPWRRGVDEVVETDADVDSGSGLPAHVELATGGPDSLAPPALAQNVETLANVPAIIRFGAAWFREVGTERAPGTVVCTVSGPSVEANVVELPMGTPLDHLVPAEPAGGGRWKAVLSGVANPVLPGDQLTLACGSEEPGDEMVRPSIAMVPSLGSRKPAIMRRVGVLPQPDGPSSETNSPAGRVRLKRSTAVTGPKRRLTSVSTRRLTWRSSAAGSRGRPGGSPAAPAPP